MPGVNITRPEEPSGSGGLQKPLPKTKKIDSPNMCGLCLYNIPQGALMIVLPGFVMLLIGCILFSMGHTDDSWNSDLVRASMILLVLGGIITIAGLVYWIVMWRSETAKQAPSQPARQVELVAIVNVDGIPGRAKGQASDKSDKTDIERHDNNDRGALPR